jgi:large subunit ribosomal protein L17
MRHRKHKKILGRPSDQRQSLAMNLMKSFFIYEKIKTTEAKAKFIKPKIEKMITLAKKNNLHSRRLIIAKIGSNIIYNKIIKDIIPRYTNRHGGYTRIIKIGSRQGDNARIVFLTLV